ncbi:MAG: tail protein X [Devosiaceae bacterium]|nr:tail protein X [Devosiaceae bacterium]
MAEYISIEGDMVDMICRKEYGDESGYVEKVFEANPKLVSYGAVLPAGITIFLPEIIAQPDLPLISLWD